jgi:hypothetical protein
MQMSCHIRLFDLTQFTVEVISYDISLALFGEDKTKLYYLLKINKIRFLKGSHEPNQISSIPYFR